MSIKKKIRGGGVDGNGEPSTVTDAVESGATESGKDNTGAAELSTDGPCTEALQVLVKIFDVGFYIIVILAVLIIFGIFIMSIINLMKYRSEKKKYDSTMKYNDVIIKDTLDYKLLSYTGQEKSKIEPLNINTIITMYTSMFILLAIYVLLLAIELGIIVGITIYKAINSAGKNENTPNGKINLSNLMEIHKSEFVIIMVFTSLAAFIIYSVTNDLYGNKTLPSLLETQSLMYNMKTKIKESLFINKDYLEALRNDDEKKIKQMVESKAKIDIDTATKMIFTYNIYKHYITMFTASDSRREEIQNIFTAEVLRGDVKDKIFEPAEYLLYTENDIDKLRFRDEYAGIINPSDTYYDYGTELRKKVTVYLDNLNNTSTKINKITLENNRANLVKYVYNLFTASFGALFIMIIGIVIVLFKNPAILEKITSFITNIYARITERATSIFSKS